MLIDDKRESDYYLRDKDQFSQFDNIDGLVKVLLSSRK